jgi:predicted transcriptional regulator
MTQNPLTIRLPEELAEALRTYAFVTHTSAHGIVEAALTEYLKAHAHTDIVRAAFDKALHLHAVAFEKLEC